MSHTQKSINKITAPGVSSIFPRTRLFHILDSALERPVVWVRGPGGSGKSMLVASYLESRNLPHIWYRLDEGDSDSATLFYYLGLAAKLTAPKNLTPLPLLTKEYLNGLLVFTRRYFESFFSRISSPFVIVFDDCQQVDAASQFHEILQSALEELSPGIKVILISRDDPPASLARLRSRGMLGFITWKDLRLNAEEIRGVLQLHNEKTWNEEAIDQLLIKTGGWLAGVVFMLEGGTTTEIPRGLTRLKSEEVVFDYIAREVFDKIDAAIQEFLLKTAFMAKFTPQMACKLTGNSAAGRILADLNARNYFTEKYSDSALTYQYHPLFREFLLHRAHDIFPDSFLFEIKQLSAEILREHGHTENAAELYIAARDWDGIIRLVEQEALSLTAQGRTATLETWIKEVPREILDETPRLLYWLGVCRFNDNTLEARRLFEISFELFKARQDAGGIFLAWSGIANSFQNEMESWQDLDHWIAVLDDLLNVYPIFPSPQVETRLALSMFTSLVLRQTDHQRIEEWGKRLFALLENSHNSVLRMKAIYSMLLHHLWRGDYAKMRLLFDSAGDSIMQQQDVSPLEIITLKTMKGFFYWNTAQADLCRQIISEALETARKTGVHLMDTRLRICLAQAELIEDDATLFEKCWKELKSIYPQGNKLNESNYHFCCAMLAMHKNNLARAASHLEEAQALVMKIGSYFHECLWHIGTAQVLFAQAKAKESLLHLAKAHELSLRIKSSSLEYMCLLTSASVLLRQGNEEAGLLTLRQAMALGRENDYVYGMWWDARMVAALCVKALEAGIEVDYVRKLIRRRHLLPDELPVACENWPWAVRVYTLGGVNLLVDDIPLPFSGKVQKKPIEMLKALIALGGAENDEGQIADLLWPEADGDTAKNSFKITLHRLRQLVVHEKLIHVRNGRLAIDRPHFWTDVWAFEQLLTAAQIEGEAGDEDKAVRLTEKALALYRGHFLSGDGDKQWVASTRTRLKNKFILNIIALGNLYQQRGDRKKAIGSYLRGLEVDAHSEEIYQNLMQCSLAMGLRAEVITIYRNCKLALAEIGAAPSVRTDSIYKTALKD
jgi:ATP/maltotriose-dependent transcriptional regulator MalT/DNA-binding SARP family transcriptional activator